MQSGRIFFFTILTKGIQYTVANLAKIWISEEIL
jgi:hypothetical protein